MKPQMLVCLLLLNGNLWAQHRFEDWTKLNLIKPLGKQFNLTGELQLRTQSDFPNQSHNPFETFKTSSWRIWINWKIKLNTEILLSPIAHFTTMDYRLSTQEWLKTKEYRQAAGLQHQIKKSKCTIKLRGLIEVRHFIKAQPIYRTRAQIQYFHPFYKKKQTEVGVLISEEYFYQLFLYRMDNNRMFTGINIQSNNLQFQTGLQWQALGSSQSGANILQLTSALNFRI